MTYSAVSVSVPTNAVPDFYESFAHWLRSWTGSKTTVDVSAPEAPVEWGSEDTALAGELWDKLSPRARAVFSVLQREPGKRFSAAWLAKELDIPHGISGVAGVFAWPARHAAKVGRSLPIHFEASEKGDGANYWMDDITAGLFGMSVGDSRS